MTAAQGTVEAAFGTPTEALAPFVRRYIGYRFVGFSPGVHRGLPSRHLTMVLSLGEPTRVGASPEEGVRARGRVSLVGGLGTAPAYIAHDGNQYGVQLELTPAGARCLLGVPAGELRDATVDLGTLIGPRATEMVERMTLAPGWSQRFAVLDEVLARRTDRLAPALPWLDHAWRRVLTSGGTIHVDGLASDLGWSRRHLSGRFTSEYGLSPKEVARVVRFERSKVLLASPHRPALADLALTCGFYDQAHLAREWNDLAGVPPTVWLATEVFPSVQDESGDREPASSHD